MGTVTIQRFTYKNPISMIGEEAGVCWGADTSDPEKTTNAAWIAWKTSTAERLSSRMSI
jgi:hypothetical protein